MDKSFLRLVPNAIKCPVCGRAHPWKGEKLEAYNENNPYRFECNNFEIQMSIRAEKIYFLANAKDTEVCKMQFSFIEGEGLFKELELELEGVEKIGTTTIGFPIFVNIPKENNFEDCSTCQFGKQCGIKNNRHRCFSYEKYDVWAVQLGLEFSNEAFDNNDCDSSSAE